MKRLFDLMLVIFAVLLLIPIGMTRSCSGDKRNGAAVTPAGNGTVRVYVSAEKKVREMPLEQYVKEVVAAEMPAEFHMEALKAQAVAARTYTFARMKKLYSSKEDRHENADICTDFSHCQAWISKSDALKKWGTVSSERYWRKIESAVDETAGVIITFEGNIINPVFHSNSGGRTENAEEVWSCSSVPYLKSVVSMGEENNPKYENTVTIKIKDFFTKLKEEYPGLKLNEKKVTEEIKILQYSEGGRVKNLRIGNTTIQGTDFRRIFALKSTNFSVQKEGSDSLKIATLGYGHGVGMSQWGANGLAASGASYEEILKYYYSGVNIEFMP